MIDSGIGIYTATWSFSFLIPILIAGDGLKVPNRACRDSGGTRFTPRVEKVSKNFVIAKEKEKKQKKEKV